MTGTCNFDYCKKKSVIIGKCKFCDNIYCGKHRLSESHECLGIEVCKKNDFLLNKRTLISNKIVLPKIQKI